ncbi:UvrD-helicase domain-containing protein [Helicobacter sp. MIT 01-3238]|uniref:UvrD-helicase domain-containing protein n=1 Tax=Helicobacter sp. MIT 01-3238 TaxID=398627 RepID=UPI0011C05317|nr:UvrD-helicase domain-containing protein [Helicobacter sp. MIT 01-3238]
MDSTTTELPATKLSAQAQSTTPKSSTQNISQPTSKSSQSTQYAQSTHFVQPLSHPFLALKASAGSGKTFSLALRFVWLLFRGAKPSEILALTFTNKATKEMQERVQNALKELANPHTLPTSPFLSQLQSMGLSLQEIKANSQKIYQEFLDSTPRICTIDAFFNSILHKFCWYVGLSQDYQMGEDIEEEELFEEFLAILSKSSIADSANIFDRLIRFCFDFDIDFSRVMEHLEVWHNDKIHFNDKFLQEIKSHSIAKTKKELAQVESSVLSTLKHLKALLEKGNASQRALNAVQATSAQEFIKKKSWTFLQKDEPREFNFFKTPLKDEAINAEFCKHIAVLKQYLKQYFLLKERVIFVELERILDAFGRAKNLSIRSSKKLSFANCALKVYELLILGEGLNVGAGGIDPQFFYFRMDNTISHILIDEFQDTSPMQYAILQPLIDEIYAGRGRDIRGQVDDRSVFFVGDSKQCIYGFRGSEAGFFDEVISHSPLHTHSLPHNYRSKKYIIDFVNACFGKIFAEQYQNQTLPQNQISQIQDCTTRATTSSFAKNDFDINGFICIAQDLSQKSNEAKSSPNKTKTISNDFGDSAKSTDSTESTNPADDTSENIVVTQVLESLQTLFLLGVQPNDIAILCFRNDDIFSINEAIKERFRNIKTTPEIKSAFVQKPSVRFILSALKFIQSIKDNHTQDNDSTQEKSSKNSADFYVYECLKIAGKKAFDFPQEKQKELLQSYKNTLKECLKKSYQTTSAHSVHFAHSANSANEKIIKPSKCILEIIKSFHIYDKNAQKLLEVSLQIVQTRHSETLSEFIARVESQSITPPKENYAGIRILTIHAAKGLEFPYVILADRLGGERHSPKNFVYDDKVYFVQKNREIVDEGFRLALEVAKNAEKIEKNNVLYVACTRAKDGLIIVPKDDKSAFEEILKSIDSSSFLDSSAGIETLKGLKDKATKKPQAKTKEEQKTTNPKILTQMPFGAQNQTLKKESQSLPNALPNAEKIRFGNALHLALEYALGFGVGDEILRNILQNHFGESIDISRLLALTHATKENPRFQAFLQKSQNPQQNLAQAQASQESLTQTSQEIPQETSQENLQEILVEVPLFFDGELKRIDLLVREGDRIFVYDYKSGASTKQEYKDEHKKQVSGYVRALKSLYSDYEINGYVAYIRDEIVWESCDNV